MKNVVDFYNKTATGWSDEWLKDKNQGKILQKFYDVFAGAGTRKPKVLDLGCGAGYDAKILESYGCRVTGVDISEKLIELAKKNVSECKFFVGDMTESLAGLGSFDGILCLASIIHVDVQKMRKTFENFAGSLKKGGILLISSCDGIGKDAQKSYASIEGDSYDKDFNCYNAQELCGFAHPTLKLVDTWRFDDFAEGWRYYVFAKV